jgi:hypothetical protein
VSADAPDLAPALVVVLLRHGEPVLIARITLDTAARVLRLLPASTYALFITLPAACV